MNSIKENIMNKHIKIIGWLWIIWGVLSTLVTIFGLIIIRNSTGASEARLITTGAVAFLIPNVIANILTGYGLFNLKGWARILAIILGIIVLLAFPIGTALGIYTLVVMSKQETVALIKGDVTPA
jgi:hypothetical protein